MNDFKTIADFIIDCMNSDGFIGIIGAMSILLTMFSNKKNYEMTHGDDPSETSAKDDERETVTENEKVSLKSVLVKMDIIQDSQDIMMDNIRAISGSMHMVNERLEGLEREMKNLKRDLKLQKQKTEQHDRELFEIKSRSTK